MAGKKKTNLDVVQISPDHVTINADHFIVTDLDGQIHIIVAQKRVSDLEINQDNIIENINIRLTPIAEIITSMDNVKKLFDTLNNRLGKDKKKDKK